MPILKKTALTDIETLSETPLTPQDMQAMQPVSRSKILRQALKLTQEEFALRFHIPLGTLRDWEQSRAIPDAPARAYLQVIAANPEFVAKALSRPLS